MSPPTFPFFTNSKIQITNSFKSFERFKILIDVTKKVNNSIEKIVAEIEARLDDQFLQDFYNELIRDLSLGPVFLVTHGFETKVKDMVTKEEL